MTQIKVEITGFRTKEEAEEFVSWYTGQGEQDASIWFECRQDEGIIDCSFMGGSKIGWDNDVLQMRVTPR